MVLLAQARYGEAEAIFGDLTSAEPEQSLHWMNLGTARRGAGHLDAALAAYSRAAALGAASADFLFNVGLTHIDRLDFESARAVLERAAGLAPTDAEIRYSYAQSCYEARRTDEALSALDGWDALTGLTTDVVANIGSLFMNLGDAVQAEAAFQRVLSDPAAHPESILSVIGALERTNRLGEARLRLDRLTAAAGAPALGMDLLLIEAQLAEREMRYDSAGELRKQVLRDIKEPHLRHFQLFRLAKCLDAANRPEEAFEALREAHQSQVAYFARSLPALSLRDVPAMTITQYGCDVTDVASWDHSDAPTLAESPIFIVAFPRSGTTLLELTLDAHPLLKSMDEQPFLQRAAQELETPTVRYPELLGRLSSAELDAVRAAYWERVGRKVRLGPGQRLVDKNPLNILRLPAIRRLFPHARVLLAVRHPCDVILSCYMQHFRSPDFALLCADMDTVGMGYRRTMDYWYEQLALLQPAAHELRYERFVADFDVQIREVCDFLEVPFHERVLAPAAHAQAKGFISTPSYSQVVQPVNQRAIGKWRAYERHFAGILPLLRPYLDRWDYEA
jgi:tetratricopeptide (TPR) repeat protein